ncbi:hypothetical protein [Amycolatopsis sp.]|uniref:hypothetical protein n=1 Tax=Amycolatopsis sp. TaxID=37632 RepID=UPI002D802DA1|nr:hypothetical protein [Amycolatopsis sp.]HET6711022.1 hypothetical protein [Amycolatopsis sp.]
MNGRNRLLRYPEERALEDAAFGQGLTPTRLFAILLPVWQVEVRATTTDGRPYELIDRYLERGIAEAGLGTTAELAGFFALDHALVDRALRVLHRIGHLGMVDGRLALTELGLRSQRDGVCYVSRREDRRKLYFDGFRSAPLSRPYYDAGVVTFLAVHEIPAATAKEGYRTFRMLHTTHGFRREALVELAGRADRDHYNLPVRIEHPETLGEECVYLPMFVVRANDPAGRIRHLVYTQASEVADPELGTLCETTPEIIGVLESDARTVSAEQTETRITAWLANQGITDCPPTRTTQGGWRVVLPAKSFQPDGPVSPAKMGSFAVLGTDLVHVWCVDRNARERAFLERLDAFLGRNVRGDADQVRSRVARIVHQFSLGDLDIARIRDMAAKSGRGRLADRLGQVAEPG